MSGGKKYIQINNKTFQLVKQTYTKNDMEIWMAKNNIKEEFNYRIKKLDGTYALYVAYK